MRLSGRRLISLAADSPPKGRIALFATCLADIFRPSVALASLKLLSRAHYVVARSSRHTCCGQPGYNAGEPAAAGRLAVKVLADLDALEPYDALVVPSASCAGMIKHHYPRLCRGKDKMRAEKLAAKTWELTEFMHANSVPVFPANNSSASAVPPERVILHDNCAGLRELGITKAPRQLLRACCGTEPLSPVKSADCCGFGGTFCVKYPQISARMADNKLNAMADASGSDQQPATVVSTDLGCLLHLAGRATRRNLNLRFYHIAEFLAGVRNRIRPIMEHTTAAGASLSLKKK